MGIITSLIPLLTVVLSIPVLRIAPTIGIVLGTILSLSGLTAYQQGASGRFTASGAGTG